MRTVNANMTADIAVYLRGGNYRVASTIAFGPQDSGTNGHRIIYQAYPGETPVLNGATKVTGWTVSSGSIYKAALSRTTKLRNLYVNDARASMTRRRSPRREAPAPTRSPSGQASWAWASGSNSDGAKYNTTDVPAIATNKDDLEIIERHDVEREHRLRPGRRHHRRTTTAGSSFSNPYGAIAQLPGLERGLQRLRHAHDLQRLRVPERARASSTSTRPRARSTTTRARART